MPGREDVTLRLVLSAIPPSFDVSAWQGTLTHFGLLYPAFSSLYAYRVAPRIWPDLPNHELDTVAAHIGHDFHHHNAQPEAETAGPALFAMIEHMEARTLAELPQDDWGRVTPGKVIALLEVRTVGGR
jgi:hypothetical protein